MSEREEQLAAQDVEARDEARMSDHLHNQQRAWSPGQAVLPPDPDGHNRLLDRGAAEHLASVAPWLAGEERRGPDDSPDFVSSGQRALEARGHERVNRHAAQCLSCQAGLCAEHGPATTATTAGAACQMCHGTGVVWMGGATGRSAWTAPVPCAACRLPAPVAEFEREFAAFRAKPAMTPAEVEASIASFADVPDDVAPAPAAEAPPKPLCVQCGQTETARGGDVHCQGDCDDASHGEPGGCHSYLAPGTEFRPYGYTAPHAHPETRASVTPAAEAKGEMSREALTEHAAELASLGIRFIPSPERNVFADALNAITNSDACLRARAREAEERAERLEVKAQQIRDAWLATGRERDEAREQRDAAKLKALNEKARADTNDELCDSFMKSSRKHAEERDVALGTVTSLRFDLAAAEAKAASLTAVAFQAQNAAIDLAGKLTSADAAREATETVARPTDRIETMLREGYAARLAAAEAEVASLRASINQHVCPYDDPSLDATDGAHSAWWRGQYHGSCKAAEVIGKAFDEPLPIDSGYGEQIESVRQRVAALRERCRRLEEAGDKMAALGTWPTACGWSLRDAWAAAKGEVPK